MYVSGAEVLAMPYVNWKPKVLLVSFHTQTLGTRGEAKGGQRLKDRGKVQCEEFPREIHSGIAVFGG